MHDQYDRLANRLDALEQYLQHELATLRAQRGSATSAVTNGNSTPTLDEQGAYISVLRTRGDALLERALAPERYGVGRPMLRLVEIENDDA